MIKLIGGGILLWLGIASFSDPTAPVFLIGFVIVGPILVVRGIKDIARGKKESAITSTMAGHADELNARLEQLQPIDRFAADFSVQYG